ncbi:acyl-CoA N-acyltransferase [Jimgerdemannia flammicorona]|uniref:Acyl-CoA N-acyltransferase n=1 Tax=Jimgerdemannia flammicorona TaxID=994334 RepID=A0A433Q9J7_9FUNG|nr:acyl-CoA N-acyltransferase [Jimgerdemannia flammicorona]
MAPQEIYIRNVLLSDVQYVERLYKIINSAYRTDESWTTEPPELVNGDRITRDGIRDLIQRNGDPNHILLAFLPSDEEGRPDDVVGTIEVKPDRTQRWGLIGLLSVDPTQQSRGIGGRLMRAAQEFIRDELEYEEARLMVIKERSDIIVWYRKLGFEETGGGERLRHPSFPKEGLVFTVFKKRLV